MILTFDSNIAKEVGTNSAVIFQNIIFWIFKNQTNERNLYDGKYWTYNSIKAFSVQFNHLTARQVKTAIDKLIEAKYLKTGNYNKVGYDRTLWYSVGESGIDFYNKTFDIKCCEKVEKESLIVKKEEENLKEIIVKKEVKRFVPPTVDEVCEYALSKSIPNIHAENFCLFYESKGWCVGKQKMINWRSAYSLWCNHNKFREKSNFKDTPQTRKIAVHVNSGGEKI